MLSGKSRRCSRRDFFCLRLLVDVVPATKLKPGRDVPRCWFVAPGCPINTARSSFLPKSGIL
jgi:hypothetical protein